MLQVQIGDSWWGGMHEACRILAAGSAKPYAAFFCPARNFAHRARCASAIFRREAAEIIRVGADVIPVGWFTFLDAPAPFNDTSSEIA